jgi:hypothetical protein
MCGPQPFGRRFPAPIPLVLLSRQSLRSGGGELLLRDSKLCFDEGGAGQGSHLRGLYARI